MEKIFSMTRDIWNTLDISPYVLRDFSHFQTSRQNQAEFIFDNYLKFFTDVWEARFRYGTFLDEYLNVGTNFLTQKQVARKYHEFQIKALEQKDDSLGVIGTATSEFLHMIVGENHDTLVKCYKFDSLGD